MEDSAIVTALKSGSIATSFLALAGSADAVWVADDGYSKAVGVAIIGTMVIEMTESGLLSIHSHDSHSDAHQCAELTLRDLAERGYRPQLADREVIVGALDLIPTPVGRTPDALVEVGGRPAEAFFV